MVVENRKANFEYTFLDIYVAGIVLQGTEVKSIRKNSCSMSDSYCIIHNGELFVKSLLIPKYEFGNIFNHEPNRDKKLLLKKNEIKKLNKQVQEKGLTIIPRRLFFNDKGKIKIEIGLAKGKNNYDKRQDIKKKDLEKEMKQFDLK